MFKDGGVTLAGDPCGLDVKNLDHSMVWVTNDKRDIGLSGFYYEIEVDGNLTASNHSQHFLINNLVQETQRINLIVYIIGIILESIRLRAPLGHEKVDCDVPTWTHYYEFAFKEALYFPFPQLIREELEGPTVWRESVWSVHSVSRSCHWRSSYKEGEAHLEFFTDHSVTLSFPSDASLQSNSSLFLGQVEKLILSNDDAHLKHIGLPRTLKSGFSLQTQLYVQREVTALSNRYCQSENELARAYLMREYLEGKASSWEPEKAIAEFEDPPKELVAAGVEPSFVSSSLLP
ncbi:hypothetical protein TorRG33x02_097660 [Trema orientale]|uniref:Uncharacterized protein n=1 Tax=Trema orientale TaxID=63057 RepID=A0A2P5F9R0_TREOI|nr:hypothetical protein TorRG33x02_097660 [Trema orientale]